jgi:hypothetical protein
MKNKANYHTFKTVPKSDTKTTCKTKHFLMGKNVEGMKNTY